jgi:hypothetical protein
MPIQVRSIEEPTLSKQQLHVIRELFHASQLNEAYKTLSFIRKNLDESGREAFSSPAISAHLDEMECYLLHQITKTLTKVKIPETPTILVGDFTDETK